MRALLERLESYKGWILEWDGTPWKAWSSWTRSSQTYPMSGLTLETRPDIHYEPYIRPDLWQLSKSELVVNRWNQGIWLISDRIYIQNICPAGCVLICQWLCWLLVTEVKGYDWCPARHIFKIYVRSDMLRAGIDDAYLQLLKSRNNGSPAGHVIQNTHPVGHRTNCNWHSRLTITRENEGFLSPLHFSAMAWAL